MRVLRILYEVLYEAWKEELLEVKWTFKHLLVTRIKLNVICVGLCGLEDLLGKNKVSSC